jgi:hypothetical protein
MSMTTPRWIPLFSGGENSRMPQKKSEHRCGFVVKVQKDALIIETRRHGETQLKVIPLNRLIRQAYLNSSEPGKEDEPQP